MRVLVLAPYVTVPTLRSLSRNRSGFGRCVWDICRYSAKNGLDVYLFTYAFGRQLKLEGVTIVGHGLTHHLHPVYMADAFDAVRVVLGGFKDRLPAKLKLGAAFMFRRYLEGLICRLKPDIIHLHGLTINTVPLLLAALSSGYPVVVTLHGLNSLDDRVPISKAEKRIEGILIEFLNREGIYISTVSNGVRHSIVRNFNLLEPNLIKVIPNGVDVQQFQNASSRTTLRTKYGIPEDARVILNVGSLTPRKNQMEILAALTQIIPRHMNDQLLLLLVGDGPERRALEGYIEGRCLKKWVRMMGYKEGQELVDIYRLADVFVLASTSEGFGLVMLEAMAAGTPVVAYGDLDAIQDLYHPECMQLVPERGPHALAAALEKALMRSWLQEVIQAHALGFSWENIVQRYMDLYKVAMSNCSGPRKITMAQLLRHSGT